MAGLAAGISAIYPLYVQVIQGIILFAFLSVDVTTNFLRLLVLPRSSECNYAIARIVEKELVSNRI
jgi:hypothetical protein